MRKQTAHGTEIYKPEIKINDLFQSKLTFISDRSSEDLTAKHLQMWRKKQHSTMKARCVVFRVPKYKIRRAMVRERYRAPQT